MSEFNQQQKLVQEFTNNVGKLKTFLQDQNQEQYIAILKIQNHEIAIYKKQIYLNYQECSIQQQCKEQFEQITSRFRTVKFPISDRSKIQKLKQDFEQIAQVYQKQCDALLSLKKREYDESQQNYRNSLQQQSLNQMSYLESLADDSSIDQLGRQKNQSKTSEKDDLAPQLQLQLDLVNEKNSELKKVQKDIKDITSIMNDIARITNEQGEQIDIISENTSSTFDNVQQQNKNLLLTKQLQEINKKRKCCLILLLVVIIAIIVIPVAIFS